MKASVDPRILFVGSVTGNDNTVGGGGVYPVADLRDLEGLAQGAKQPVSMIDGYNFNGAKAYKDSKLCLMMIANEMHDRYHKSTGIAFNSIYPGCIADSPLFREKRPWFRKYFPVFMKYITGGYVGEEEAGKRLFQTVVDPRCYKSGIYWSWNGGPRIGRGADALKNDGNIIGAGGAGGDWDSIYENDVSDKVKDKEKAELLWKFSTQVTGAEWPPAKQPKSPCPTLLVISFVTNILDTKERIGRKAKPATMKEVLSGSFA
jgi:protochlorophyllide reductase